ncbi:ElyC/SanA/YdcF family protein [Halomonas sp. PAMB 3264]|uniref:SanA/YdcF family protein n=1 Tax=Halomonas sp. PAMB 3264 TaxID=3075222 RepID=UPI0028A1A094|nr:ElyC/SanA/YdcF family protein [Halomonas sp. PAMB 3264]WNL41096.1 ElyC/SanA/YdcF family protein [Halomonas sp. PAMB 3264]
MASFVKRTIKWLLMSLAALLLLATFVFIAGNVWVLASTARYIDRPVAQCRTSDVAVVFGTSNWTRSGLRNPHFNARMRTSADLIARERVNHLLLSGDNRTQAYNEPRAMWRDLHRRGVPSTQMTLDFAGFSTYDTLARAKDVFQLNEAVLVTQSWHLPRAVYIGRSLGMEVTGCVAEQRRAAGEWRLRLREVAARVATLGDLYLWGRAPHFLGPAEPIEVGPGEAQEAGYVPLVYRLPVVLSLKDAALEEADATLERQAPKKPAR